LKDIQYKEKELKKNNQLTKVCTENMKQKDWTTQTPLKIKGKMFDKEYRVPASVVHIAKGHCDSIDWCLVFNATFSNISAISWRPVLVVEEAGVHGENLWPWASKW